MVKYFMVKQLQKVLSSVKKELKNDKSIWDKDQIAFIIKPEIEELLSHFKVGTVFFKYGKKQRMLSSTYIITDSMKKLRNTNLGKDILKLQNIYNKL